MKKNIRRRLLGLLAITLVTLSLHAGLNVARTEHFQIIYAEASVEMAKELYDNAEDCYSRLVTAFGKDPELSLPIYITREEKVFNAYYTPAAYNRIVLFDATSDISMGLSNMASSTLDTFLHELTHAFTANLVSPFGRFLQNAFGDIFTFNQLKNGLLMTEGAAVLMESQEGYGRINDPSAMHLLKEARLEALDLHFYDMYGNRTLTPGANASYIFGAGFLSYLQETYGLEKTLSFVMDRNRYSITTTGHSFRKVFGFSLSQAWGEFMASLPVPEKVREAENITPWGSYGTLAFSGGELYSVVFSSYGVERLTGEPERLFTSVSYVDYLSVDEGGMMLVSRVLEDKAKVDLVTSSGTILHSFQDSIAGAFVGDHIVLIGSESQRGTITLYDGEGQEFCTFTLGYGDVLSSPVGIDEGRAAFLLTRGGVEHLLILDIGKRELALLENPEAIFLRSLSAQDGVLSFSWTPRDDASALTRYGELVEEEGGWRLRLSSVEFLGGLWSPVRDGEKVYFISQYFDHMAVSRTTREELELEEGLLLSASPYEEGKRIEGTEEFLLSSSSYNPFAFMQKGITIPLVGEVVTSYGYDVDTLGLGMIYMTQDPTEKHEFTMALAYDFSKFAYSFSYTYNGLLTFTESRAFVDGLTPFERSVRLSPTFTLRHAGETLNVTELLSWTGGSPGMNPGLHNMVQVTYQNLRKAGLNRHAVKGYGVQTTLYDLSPVVSLQWCVPRLLPFSSDSYTITNLPLILSLRADFLGTEDIDLTFAGKVYFYSKEYQKYLSHTGLFLTTLDLWAQTGVDYSVRWGEAHVNGDLVASVNLSPVIGNLGSTLSLDVGVSLHCMDGSFFFGPYLGGSL